MVGIGSLSVMWPGFSLLALYGRRDLSTSTTGVTTLLPAFGCHCTALLNVTKLGFALYSDVYPGVATLIALCPRWDLWHCDDRRRVVAGCVACPAFALIGVALRGMDFEIYRPLKY
jgi:hypothetical protein